MGTHCKREISAVLHKFFFRTSGNDEGVDDRQKDSFRPLTTSAGASVAAMTPSLPSLRTLLFIGVKIGCARMRTGCKEKCACCSKAEVKLKAFWKGLWKGAWSRLDTCWHARCNDHRRPFPEKSQSCKKKYDASWCRRKAAEDVTGTCPVWKVLSQSHPCGLLPAMAQYGAAPEVPGSTLESSFLNRMCVAPRKFHRRNLMKESCLRQDQSKFPTARHPPVWSVQQCTPLRWRSGS